MRRILFTLLMVITSLLVYAQQDAQYSQYMFNGLVINPAYAGYKENINISLMHRNQWAGISGAPSTQSLVVDGAFFKDNSVGLGLSIVNDHIGLQGQTSAYVNYAYRLAMGEESRLAFGIAAGMAQYTLNGDKAFIDDPTDPTLSGKQSYYAPDARAGIFYSDSKFYAGFSATNLFSQSINYANTAKNKIVRQGRNFFLTAGYLYDIDEDMKFKPSILIREDTKGPTNIDVNAFVLLKETIWLGASYRTGVNIWHGKELDIPSFNQNSMVGTVEFFFAKKFRVGYAYDYGLSKLAGYSNGTHEISLGVILNTQKKSTALLTPRYF